MLPINESMSHVECQKVLRRLELEAYCGLVSAFRAQGELTPEKRELLKAVQQILSISTERHKAEVRRAFNDETLTNICETLNDSNASLEWAIEGRRLVPLIPRLVPQTVYLEIANRAASEAQALNRSAQLAEQSKKEDETHPIPNSSSSPTGSEEKKDKADEEHIILPRGTKLPDKSIMDNPNLEELFKTKEPPTTNKSAYQGLMFVSRAMGKSRKNVTSSGPTPVGAHPQHGPVAESPYGGSVYKAPKVSQPEILPSSGQKGLFQPSVTAQTGFAHPYSAAPPGGKYGPPPVAMHMPSKPHFLHTALTGSSEFAKFLPYGQTSKEKDIHPVLSHPQPGKEAPKKHTPAIVKKSSSKHRKRHSSKHGTQSTSGGSSHTSGKSKTTVAPSIGEPAKMSSSSKKDKHIGFEHPQASKSTSPVVSAGGSGKGPSKSSSSTSPGAGSIFKVTTVGSSTHTNRMTTSPSALSPSKYYSTPSSHGPTDYSNIFSSPYKPSTSTPHIVKPNPKAPQKAVVQKASGHQYISGKPNVIVVQKSQLTSKTGQLPRTISGIVRPVSPVSTRPKIVMTTTQTGLASSHSALGNARYPAPKPTTKTQSPVIMSPGGRARQIIPTTVPSSEVNPLKNWASGYQPGGANGKKGSTTSSGQVTGHAALLKTSPSSMSYLPPGVSKVQKTSSVGKPSYLMGGMSGPRGNASQQPGGFSGQKGLGNSSPQLGSVSGQKGLGNSGPQLGGSSAQKGPGNSSPQLGGVSGQKGLGNSSPQLGGISGQKGKTIGNPSPSSSELNVPKGYFGQSSHLLPGGNSSPSASSSLKSGDNPGQKRVPDQSSHVVGGPDRESAFKPDATQSVEGGTPLKGGSQTTSSMVIVKQKSSTAKSLSVVTEEVKGQGSSNNPKEDDSTTGVGVSSDYGKSSRSQGKTVMSSQSSEKQKEDTSIAELSTASAARALLDMGSQHPVKGEPTKPTKTTDLPTTSVAMVTPVSKSENKLESGSTQPGAKVGIKSQSSKKLGKGESPLVTIEDQGVVSERIALTPSDVSEFVDQFEEFLEREGLVMPEKTGAASKESLVDGPVVEKTEIRPKIGGIQRKETKEDADKKEKAISTAKQTKAIEDKRDQIKNVKVVTTVGSESIQSAGTVMSKRSVESIPSAKKLMSKGSERQDMGKDKSRPVSLASEIKHNLPSVMLERNVTSGASKVIKQSTVSQVDTGLVKVVTDQPENKRPVHKSVDSRSVLVDSKEGSGTAKPDPLQKTDLSQKTDPLLKTNLLQKTDPFQKTDPLQKTNLLQKTTLLQKTAPFQKIARLQKTDTLKKTDPLQKSDPLQKTDSLQKPDPYQWEDSPEQVMSDLILAISQPKISLSKMKKHEDTVKEKRLGEVIKMSEPPPSLPSKPASVVLESPSSSFDMSHMNLEDFTSQRLEEDEDDDSDERFPGEGKDGGGEDRVVGGTNQETTGGTERSALNWHEEDRATDKGPYEAQIRIPGGKKMPSSEKIWADGSDYPPVSCSDSSVSEASGSETQQVRASKRKRKAPTPIDEESGPSSMPSWARAAWNMLLRVMRFRGANRAKGDINAASWFNRPVDPKESPEYFKIIKTPMDFSTIKRNLENGLYQGFTDFHHDMIMVRRNCLKFNPPGHKARKDCDEVFQFYQEEYNKTTERWGKAQSAPKSPKRLRPDQTAK
ncbi:uncharacterized protein [Apostichopus japonicus]|uniref:uncharacterized protein isoform X2 n=1 Tax=Stichopus japonicus TaxID=307972 RepID=UPI003AB50ADC